MMIASATAFGHEVMIAGSPSRNRVLLPARAAAIAASSLDLSESGTEYQLCGPTTITAANPPEAG